MANIIQQFKNANGDNVFPLAYAQGGMKMDLLWTNPSPTNNFDAQTVSLDLSDYALVCVVITSEPGTNMMRKPNILLIDSSIRQTCSGTSLNGTGTVCFSFERGCTVSNSGVSFEKSGYEYSGGQDPSTVAHAIPYQIYGIKMSYIVPTTVHGLQYVEV